MTKKQDKKLTREDIKRIEQERKKFFKFLENGSTKPSPKTAKFKSYIGTTVSKSTGQSEYDSINARISDVLTAQEMYAYPEIREAVLLIVNKLTDWKLFYVNESHSLLNDAEMRIPTQLIEQRVNNILWKRHRLIAQMFILYGVIFIRKIYDPDTKSISDIQILSPLETTINFDEWKGVKYYMHNGERIEENEMYYANWGEFYGKEQNIATYLSSSERTYRQLKSMENSLVSQWQLRTKQWIHWKINDGETDSDEANAMHDQFLTDLRHSNSYNPATGEINQGADSPDVIRHVVTASDSFNHGVEASVLKLDLELPSTENIEYMRKKLRKGLFVLQDSEDSRSYVNIDEIKSSEQEVNMFIYSIAERLEEIYLNLIQDIAKLKTPKWHLYNYNNIRFMPEYLYITRMYVTNAIREKLTDAKSKVIENVKTVTENKIELNSIQNESGEESMDTDNEFDSQDFSGDDEVFDTDIGDE